MTQSLSLFFCGHILSERGVICEKLFYIAMSLDGFIADSQGCVHWLEGDGSDPKHLGGYPSFVQTIDTILMGYQTYNQITKELSVGQWPYMNQ